MTVLTSQMRQITRRSQVLLNAAREGTAQMRYRLDVVDSELRGVEYEHDRVRQEIEQCEEYQ
jgi:THO complex subunit 5